MLYSNLPRVRRRLLFGRGHRGGRGSRRGLAALAPHVCSVPRARIRALLRAAREARFSDRPAVASADRCRSVMRQARASWLSAASCGQWQWRRRGPRGRRGANYRDPGGQGQAGAFDTRRATQDQAARASFRGSRWGGGEAQEEDGPKSALPLRGGRSQGTSARWTGQASRPPRRCGDSAQGDRARAH